MLNVRKLRPILATLLIASFTAVATLGASTGAGDRKVLNESRVRLPLNLAILIQDDLVSHVGNELGVIRAFIRSLPEGSQVMIGYITTGTLQLRREFTSNLDEAAGALRIPVSSNSASPFNPYVEVVEALRRFDPEDMTPDGKNPSALLLISDGLDVSRGFDPTSILHSVDLERAIKEARRRQVTIYSFYAPSVGLTRRSRLAASFGQSSLNRLSNETGGKAFFQGTTDFVTFDSHFERLTDALNHRYYGDNWR